MWCRAALTANALLAHTYSFSNRRCGGDLNSQIECTVVVYLFQKCVIFVSISMWQPRPKYPSIPYFKFGNVFSSSIPLLSSTLKMDGRLRPLLAAEGPASRLFFFVLVIHYKYLSIISQVVTISAGPLITLDEILGERLYLRKKTILLIKMTSLRQFVFICNNCTRLYLNIS